MATTSGISKSWHYGYTIVICCLLIMLVAVGLVMSCAGIFYKPVSQELGLRSERSVHQPYPHPDWREVRQDCRSSSLALAVAERRNHHPEDCSQGTNAGESESLRLRARC